MWRSFHYDENTDTIDSCISKIKQVGALLNYGEPQILELFKNTLPSNLYGILFPINNLQEAVDAAKRVLTKEKLDKQLSGQTANSTAFMKMGDTMHTGKKMSIKPQDSIKERLENLTSMMYKVSIQQEEGKKPFKPQVHPKEEEDKEGKILVTEIEVEIMIGKDKISDKPRMDTEMVTEEVMLCKEVLG